MLGVFSKCVDCFCKFQVVFVYVLGFVYYFHVIASVKAVFVSFLLFL